MAPPASPAAGPTRRKSTAKKTSAPQLDTPAPASPADDRYEKHRDAAGERGQEISKKGREIGPLPPVAKPARREACRASLRLFCETYFRDEKFRSNWSDDHLTAIARLETCITEGGQFAFAMPRGSGKTTLTEAAAEWAILFGYRKFVVIVGATAEAAKEILDSIKEDLQTNDLLADDFPEACYPIQRLDMIAQRCKGQRLNGQPTRQKWGDNEIHLADVPGADSSKAILRVAGIEGRIRGLKRGGGRRPDLVILDDPQTDESAATPIGNAKRKRIVERVCLKLAGPKKKIAAIMPCTVIFPGDMVDEFLDREKHPRWNGERTKTLYAFPTNKALWEEYAERRRESFRKQDGGKEATAFYKANRAEMDAGAKVAWPDRYNEDELSALQSAMNRWIDDPRGFMAEDQNEPEEEGFDPSCQQLTEPDLFKKLIHLRRGTVPRDCTRVTAFVDMQKQVLFWMIVAWTDSFGGTAIDWGAWPKQRREIFEADDPSPKLTDVFPGQDEKTRLYSALAKCVPWLLGLAFPQAGSSSGLTVDLLMIDTGYAADVVHNFIQNSPLKSRIKASKGMAGGVTSKLLCEYRKEEGDKVGSRSGMPGDIAAYRIDGKGGPKGRFVAFEANGWKSAVADGILAPSGAAGSLYVAGGDGGQLELPELLKIHFLSEHRSPIYARGRRVEIWKKKPNCNENHWWDGWVGCMVGACVVGLHWSASTSAGEAPVVTSRPAPKSWSQLRAEKMGQGAAVEETRRQGDKETGRERAIREAGGIG